MNLKEEILSRLMNGEVSGERLAAELGVTRAAVWKGMRALKREGYRIDAVTNRGYRLLPSDVLNVWGIRKELTTAWETEVLSSVTSTNAVARERAASGKTDYAVVADTQTAGRGRFSRPFFSPPGAGIYLSAVLRPAIPASECGKITAYAAVAVARAVEKLTGADVKIKWVNDLQIGGKKICGILTEGGVGLENGALEYAVVGIGVNVRSVRFPAELADIATTVEDATGVRADRCALVAAILDGLSRLPEEIVKPSFAEEYRRRSCVVGRTVVVNGEYEAVAERIDDDCALRVDRDGEKIKLTAGEVSVKLK